jgi:hypothetical protein
MTITDRDRKRLWGKSGGRCARCRCLLFHPGEPGARETVIGEEAHIIGERPSAARYQPLSPDHQDAYENRILLCANDHVVIDGQPQHWTTERLRRLKDEHEQAMTSRTADRRPDGVQFHMPQAVRLDTVMTGPQLLDIVGPAYAYVFEHDELERDVEHAAAEDLLGQAHDLGEIYSMISPAERIDAARDLSESVLNALRGGLLLRGARIDVDVTINGEPDRWPVGILVLRKAVVVAKEQKAAQEAEQALRDDGIEGLEAWAEAVSSEQHSEDSAPKAHGSTSRHSS